VKINGKPSLIDISRSAANLLGDFIEDHPKSGTGVEAAAVEVTKLLDRFRAEFEILENQSTWSRDMMLMGAPLSQWPIVPGLKVWPAEAE
jgi:hypothetical protein